MKIKKILKTIFVMGCVSTSLLFMSCINKDVTQTTENESNKENTQEKQNTENNNSDSKKSSYSLEVSKDYLLLNEGDESSVITVTTNGTFTIEIEDETYAKAQILENNITITPLAEGSTTVVLTCVEDSSLTKEILVEIKSLHEVTLNIDSSLQNSVASIEVYYEGKENGEETATKKGYAIVEYTKGEATAKVKFRKTLSDSYNFFNNIKVTLKNEEGNIIESSCSVSYFCYSATEGDGYITQMNVTPPVASKTFKINFSGFTIPGGSVTGIKYSNQWATNSSSWNEENIIVVDNVTVSQDGSYAEFSVSKDTLLEEKLEFYIDWTLVEFIDSSSNKIQIISGLEDANKWYSYNGEVWEIQATSTDTSGYTAFANAKSITVESNNTYTQIFTKEDLQSITFNSLEIIVASSTESAWLSLSGATAWAESTYKSNCINVTSYITEEAFISAIKENGLYIESSAGTFEITLSYK